MPINKNYISHERIDDAYWRELGVRIDWFKEITSDQRQKELLYLVERMNSDELNEFGNYFKLPSTSTDDIKQLQNIVYRNIPEEFKDKILFLRDFLNRKKRSVVYYYRAAFSGESERYTTPLIQLVQMYEDKPSRLFEIFTFHLWSSRGTGNRYVFNKKLSLQISKDIAKTKTFTDTLRDELWKSSKEKHNYRPYAYANIEDQRIIVLWYKEVADTPKADFQTAIRHREVNMLLFEMNLKNQTIEIKPTANYEEVTIKGYLETTYNDTCSLVKSQEFQGYSHALFHRTMVEGESVSGKPIADFIVEKVAFRDSPLKHSPMVSFYKKGIDIWPAVVQAFEHNTISLKSPKDVASLTVKGSGMNSRVINSKILPNGNLLFYMDDSNLDEAKKNEIEKKFIERFGFPLYQEISNGNFQDGHNDLIDYIMSQPTQVRHTSTTEVIYEEMVEKGYLVVREEKWIGCQNCGCQITLQHEEKIPSICKECDMEMVEEKQEYVDINLSNIFTAVKQATNQIVNNEDWYKQSDTIVSFCKTKHKTIHLVRASDGRHLRVIATDQILTRKSLTLLSRQMIPTILILVGQQDRDTEKFTKGCIEAISFGQFISMNEEQLKVLYNRKLDDILIRMKQNIANNAHQSYQSLLKLLVPPSEVKNYSAGDLEDDVYFLFKEILGNVIKWGKEKSGSAVPEGLFTISYRLPKSGELIRSQYVFSYDCKYAKKDEGYNLDRDEKRKAGDYVESLNQDPYVSSYARKHELSAHVFVSNKFQDIQLKGMQEYFEERFEDECKTKPVFLPVDVLVHLYEQYRTYHGEILKSIDIFLEGLFKALTNKTGCVTKEHVDRIISTVLDPDLIQRRTLDEEKVSTSVSIKEAI